MNSLHPSAQPQEEERTKEQVPIFLSVVVPCYNEEDAIEIMVLTAERELSHIPGLEIVVVDDGSVDGTGEILNRLARVVKPLRVIRHTGNRGYGAALKTGIRNSCGQFLATMDADGTYPIMRIPDLLAQAENGADMVVGARIGKDVTYSKLRAFPKIFMRWFCVWVTRQPIPDINSGLRIFKRDLVERFLPHLPDTFSFTTTVTIAFVTRGYRVDYIPICYSRRVGTSKISPLKDTLRFFQLIIRTGIYFAPLRVFAPVIVILWAGFLAALGYDLFAKNLSDKTVLLLTLATNVTILALLADMIDKRLN